MLYCSPELLIARLKQPSCVLGLDVLCQRCINRNGAVFSALGVNERDEVLCYLFGSEFFRFAPSGPGCQTNPRYLLCIVFEFVQ
jgi:hypothetical protein